jgi:MSHA biogenesis protein MshQ
MYYGNSTCDNQQNPTGVWDNDYVMVQHLNESSGTLYDSTTYDNDATNNGCDYGTGFIDGAYTLIDTGADYLDAGTFNELDDATQATFSMWIKLTAAELGEDGDLFTKGTHSINNPLLIWRDDSVGSGDQSGNTNCISAFIDDGPNVRWISSPSGTMNDVNWHYVTVTYKDNDATGINIYIDGVHQQSGDTTNVDFIPQTADPLRMGADRTGGGQRFDGTMDEIRVSTVARNASWINTSYNTMNYSDTFIQLGEQQQVDFPTISDPDPDDKATEVIIKLFLST